MQHRWIHRSISSQDVLKRMQRDLNNLPEALVRALLLRGVETLDQARLFFRGTRENLHDPFLMKDMDLAASRVREAVEGRERVLVYGDYDVDGTTATALMVSFLRSVGVDATYFIPDRFKDGYGLKCAGIDAARDAGASLIIALDCGITATEEAAYARPKGIDLIICDHHTPKETLPDALAVVDPKRSDCSYPFKELSGCALGYKLAEATLDRMGRDPSIAAEYLDLVAVSTASDIVPMKGENRILMREGLAILASTPRVGLRQLAAAADTDLTNCTTSDIVFALGPRINAAGRLGHASLAVDLMLSDDAGEALRIARQLNEMNGSRRTLDGDTLKSAVAQADRYVTAGMRHSVVLHDPSWHLGVIGIVASRIVERYYRPAVLLANAQGDAKGSARSIAGVNIYEALSACSDLLTQFGGHDFAAGLSLPEENVPAFRERFDAVVAGMIDPDMLIPAIEVDASLKLKEIDTRFWSVLRQFGPFGPDNLQPVFHATGIRVCGRPRAIGSGGQHLKFSARDGDGSPTMDVIAFKMGDRLPLAEASERNGTPLELLFTVEENRWNGRTSLQLKARDIRDHSLQA